MYFKQLLLGLMLVNIKRISLLLALTIIFSVLQSITKPNIANANPYDNNNLYRDLRDLNNGRTRTGRTCNFLAYKINEAAKDYKNNMARSKQSVNQDNKFRYAVNARDSYNQYQSLLSEWRQKGCDK